MNENSIPKNLFQTNENYETILNQILNEISEYFIFQALIKIKSDKNISKKIKLKCGIFLNFTLYRSNGVFSLLNLFSLIEEGKREKFIKILIFKKPIILECFQFLFKIMKIIIKKFFLN